ncbi:hypothetical protein LZQ00_14640 [Sphingobacterium sp. SRCM116780]|uniref:hypothetical protein n=1 Tax=Sphingobacterium sp. SRCM116780 TaxID=2907623 RepID=UPI001F1B585E|nr:hypothetical protein [Sphingobacterium sp. SRCM116780]UIR55497.1 hypothetical protein LZQ00_14640 [Sphingobacterium sp. SRCM116780]
MFHNIFQIKYLFILLCAFLFVGCHQTKNPPQQFNKFDTEQIVRSEKKDSLVFSNDTLSLYRIDSILFFKQKDKFQKKADTLLYITDFNKVKELLKNSVVFGGWNDEKNIIDSNIEGGMIALVRPTKGAVLDPNQQQYSWDSNFVAYYPTEEILLLEGGHTSDFSIDLSNGKYGADRVGNPQYILYSPNRKYRLNGWFPGQECSEYFFQRKTKNGFERYGMIPMAFGGKDFVLCTIKDQFWTSDHEIYFRNHFYGNTTDDRLGFFRLALKD